MAVLSIPTFLIMVSWNSLPGSGLYPVKRGLEKVALALVTPSMQATAKLRARLIDRRFAEANSLFIQSSQTLGFIEFDDEVLSAKEDILKKAQDENSDERVVEQEINDLLAKLEKYNLELEAQKQSYIAYNPQVAPSPQPTTTTIVIPGKSGLAPSKTITYTAPAPIPAQQPQQPQQPQQSQTRTVSQTVIINQVNQSQGNLNSTIDALRQEQERLQQQILAQQLRLQSEQEERIRNQQRQTSHTSTPTPTPAQQPAQEPSQQPSQQPQMNMGSSGDEPASAPDQQPVMDAAPPPADEPQPAAAAAEQPSQPQEPSVESKSQSQEED